jgi:hypothetical protein
LASENDCRVFFFGLWRIGIPWVGAPLTMSVGFAMPIDLAVPITLGFGPCRRGRTCVNRQGNKHQAQNDQKQRPRSNT